MLENWDLTAIKKHESSIRECIKRGISDASAQARKQARRSFAAFAPIFPEVAEKLLLYCDHRTQKTLRAIMGGKPAASRPAKVKKERRSRPPSISSSPSSSEGSSPHGSPRIGAIHIPSEADEHSKKGSGGGGASGSTRKKYMSISPKFHGVQIDQDDLVASVGLLVPLKFNPFTTSP